MLNYLLFITVIILLIIYLRNENKVNKVNKANKATVIPEKFIPVPPKTVQEEQNNIINEKYPIIKYVDWEYERNFFTNLTYDL